MSRDPIGFQSTHPNAPASGFSGSELMLTLVYPHELSGQSTPVSSGLTLGRAPEADVTSIFHPTISRRHAEIRLGLGGLLCLSDLASRNGTFVDGRRTQLPVPFGAQSVVRLGDVLAVVHERSHGRFDDDPVLPGTGARIQQIRSEL